MLDPADALGRFITARQPRVSGDLEGKSPLRGCGVVHTREPRQNFPMRRASVPRPSNSPCC